MTGNIEAQDTQEEGTEVQQAPGIVNFDRAKLYSGESIFSIGFLSLAVGFIDMVIYLSII
jgi:hypothetical protein